MDKMQEWGIGEGHGSRENKQMKEQGAQAGFRREVKERRTKCGSSIWSGAGSGSEVQERGGTDLYENGWDGEQE